MHIKPLSARKNRDKKCSWSKSTTLYSKWAYAISFIPINNKTGNDKMKFSLWLHIMKEGISVKGNILYIALRNDNNLAFFSFRTFHGFCRTVILIYNSNQFIYRLVVPFHLWFYCYYKLSV